MIPYTPQSRPSWENQLVRAFPAFYRNGTFITAQRSLVFCIISKRIQFTSSYWLKIQFNIILPSMCGYSNLSPFPQPFWQKFCAILHTWNKIIFISNTVNIKWVLSNCHSSAASQLLCICIRKAPVLLYCATGLNKLVSWCWTWWPQSFTTHHYHTAPYIQFGVVMMRGKRATEKAATDIL